ncbi:MAG TPA: o-succinylbenzoate synthase [Verrucomicrobiae bacterium]|nr:o-succinylbenzoate synthase [Verrucomicrobiae bacterium]
MSKPAAAPLPPFPPEPDQGRSDRTDGLAEVRVEGARLRLVELPLVRPFTTSVGTDTVKTALLVELVGDGLRGWGECVADPGPSYFGETLVTARHVLTEYLLPEVVGSPRRPVADHLRRITWVRGHPMAQAALEMALLDLAGQATGRSLAQILGGVRVRVACGVSVGIEATVAATLRAVDGYCAEGYQRVKLKCRPGRDERVVAAVRRAFPTLPLTVDGNAAYTLADLAVLQRLDRYGLLMIEQPLAHDDLVDHARLQALLRTPVCLDESVPSVASARAAIALRAGGMINLKPGRVGGLLAAAAIHDLCGAAGWPTWVGGMLETGIGRAANVALASLPNNTLAGDTSASDRYFSEDLVAEPFRLGLDGTLAVPTRPGLGAEPDPERLARVTTWLERFTGPGTGHG